MQPDTDISRPAVRYSSLFWRSSFHSRGDFNLKNLPPDENLKHLGKTLQVLGMGSEFIAKLREAIV